MPRQSPNTAAQRPEPRRGVTCELDDTPTSALRRQVREVLAGHSGLLVDDAVLVVDELASNAQRHGLAPRVCRLTLLNGGRVLRVEVDDAAARHPRIRPPDHSGGNGLLLVDRLTTGWGVHQYAGHKTVWAELDLDQHGNGRAPHLRVTTS